MARAKKRDRTITRVRGKQNQEGNNISPKENNTIPKWFYSQVAQPKCPYKSEISDFWG